MPRPRRSPITVSVDIGGTGIKALAMAANLTPRGSRRRVLTPRPAVPRAVLEAVAHLLEPMRPFDRVTIGFPGVVVDGVARTAPNLDGAWRGVDLRARLGPALGVPLRVLNDADMQGFGAVRGRGSEMVITLGTGMGSAFFVEGRLWPNLELGHHPFEKGETYEQRIGQPALDRIGRAAWNRRLARAIELMRRTFNFDTLYVGGGNARCIRFHLPGDVVVVSNSIAFAGGVKVWEAGRG
jgi:polyphosphate glucokinase